MADASKNTAGTTTVVDHVVLTDIASTWYVDETRPAALMLSQYQSPPSVLLECPQRSRSKGACATPVAVSLLASDVDQETTIQFGALVRRGRGGVMNNVRTIRYQGGRATFERMVQGGGQFLARTLHWADGTFPLYTVEFGEGTESAPAGACVFERDAGVVLAPPRIGGAPTAVSFLDRPRWRPMSQREVIVVVSWEGKSVRCVQVALSNPNDPVDVEVMSPSGNHILSYRRGVVTFTRLVLGVKDALAISGCWVKSTAGDGCLVHGVSFETGGVVVNR